MKREMPTGTRVWMPWLATFAIAGCAFDARPPAPPVQPPASALALACRTCHDGPDRERHARALDGLAPADIAAQLRAYRDGTREGTVMPRLARALDDAEIEALATMLGRSP